MNKTQYAQQRADHLAAVDYIMDRLIDSGLVDATTYHQALIDIESLVLYWELQLI